MKEWCLEHPVLTFLICVCICDCLSSIFGK